MARYARSCSVPARGSGTYGPRTGSPWGVAAAQMLPVTPTSEQDVEAALLSQTSPRALCARSASAHINGPKQVPSRPLPLAIGRLPAPRRFWVLEFGVPLTFRQWAPVMTSVSWSFGAQRGFTHRHNMAFRDYSSIRPVACSRLHPPTNNTVPLSRLAHLCFTCSYDRATWT